MTNKGSDLLVMEQVTAGYGEAVVLEDVSLTIKEGESLALLGRNGMGKTTLLLTMMGLTTLHKGKLAWQGNDITNLTTYRRAQAGLGWVPQERHMYPSLSVEEHLTVVARPGEWTVPKIYQVFPRLQERRNNMGNQLSGGEQQMLAIARALCLEPKVLLLDEPTEGLQPSMIALIREAVLRLKAGGVAVVLVEQRVEAVLQMADRVAFMAHGRVEEMTEAAALSPGARQFAEFVGV